MKGNWVFSKGNISFLIILFLFVGIFCLFPGLVFSGENTWTSNGPSGARILSLAIDPNDSNTIYAGSEDIYKTTDGGTNWQSTGLLENVSIQSLLIDPGDSNTIYAGTSAGMYKSTDAGDSWALAGLSTSNSVTSLLYDNSTTPDTIYAGTNQGIFKSADGGSSWSTLPLGSLQINALALDLNTSDPRTIYTATSTQGIFRSSDGGSNWTAISSGLPANTSIFSLSIDPITTSTIYAGTSGNGVYKSTDSGSSWSASNTGLATNATIYALAIDPGDSNTIYAGTDSGVYKSTDGGSNWSASNTGIASGNTVYSLAIDANTTSTLYAGTSLSGAYQSIDSGANWSAINNGIPIQSNISALVIDPASPQNLYAAGSLSVGTGGSASTVNAVFKSTDSGSSWSTVTDGISTDSILSLAIDPNTPTTLYAGTLNGGIYKSTDSGSNWTALTNGILSNTTIYTIAIDPSDANTVYAGGYYVLDSVNISVIYKSTDGGSSWSFSNTGMPQAALVFALAIDPLTPATLYAGTASGIYKSIDGGSNWSLSNDGIDSGNYIYSLAMDPDDPTIIYAGTGNSTKTGGGEVMKSTNSGTTWVATGSQITNTVVNALAIDMTTSTIYAGTLTGGVYMTRDSGDSWLAINPGLGTAGSVETLVINSNDPSILHIGTQTGVYSFDFENRAPNTPSNPSPAHNSEVTTVSTWLSWAGGDPDPWDTVTYDVYWDGPGNNDNPPRWATNHNDTSIDISPLQNPSTDYYWKIVARDNNGVTSTSPIWKFTSAAVLTNNPPSRPSNPNPSDNATNQAINLSLRWISSDPDNDLLTFDLFLGTTFPLSELATDLSDNRYAPTNLNFSTTYYWYIIADDGRGSTITGPTWRFTTGSTNNSLPNVPSNPSPFDGATGQSIDITLSWSGGDPDGDALTFALYLGTNPTNLSLKFSGFSDNSINPGTLNFATTYYWQIEATDSRGAIRLSDIWSFTTKTSAVNNVPIASAGTDRTVITGDATTLDGSSSSDPEGDALTFSWSFKSQPNGSNASISNASSQLASFTPNVDGAYRIQLQVSDGTDLSTDIIQIVSLGKDFKILIDTDKEDYVSGDTLKIYVWVGNPSSSPEIKVDAFIGLGLPDGSLLFFDPALTLKTSDINDPSSYTAFAQDVTLPPGLVFPGTQEMDTDSDGNGKQDSFKLFSVALNPLVPQGQYFTFAALAQAGSAQSGNPIIIGNISLAFFNFTP